MEITATAKSVRMSPRKVRLIADAIRAMSLEEALITLSVLQKRAATPLAKVLRSAIANAEHNGKVTKDSLFIAGINVTEAPAFKRFHPSTRGRVHPYKRKGSHITVVLKTKEKGEKGA